MTSLVEKAGEATTCEHCHIEKSLGSENGTHLPHEAREMDIEMANARVVTADEVQKYSKTDDEAMKAMAEYDGPPLVLDKRTSQSLLRKIDWHVLPILFLVWGMNYLDKTCISYASVMGLKTDLNLKGNEYSTLGSLYYIGQLVWEFPTSRFLQYLPVAKYSSFCVITWGVILACFAAVSDFKSAAAVRFLLGAFESCSMPAFALIAAQWYTTREQNKRAGIFISANGVAQIVGGLVAYGVAKRVDEHGSTLAGWKIIFIGLGCVTILVGLAFLFVVPDSQLNCRWLDKRERLLAIERVKDNGQGIGNKHFKWYQFREVFLDPHFWALFMYGVLSDIPNGGLTTFFSQLIKGFGFTSLQSLLYGFPGGAVVIVACWSNGWAGDRFGNRTLFACVPMTCALIGMILIIALPITHDSNIGRLVGFYMTQAIPATGATVLSLVSSNVAGYTKKSTVAAFYLVGYCVGNIIGPYTFTPEAAPRYVSAEITIMICYALCIVDLLFINWWYRRLNRQKAATRARPDYVRMENQAWRDLTDRENPEFIYTL